MKRTEVVNAMRLVVNATDKVEDSLIGTDSFIFTGNRICTFNNRLSFSYPLPIDLDCSIKAHDTLKIVEKMKGEELEISQKEDHVFISDGKTRSKMKILEDDEKIRSKLANVDLDNIEWREFPKEFFEGVKLCYFTAAQDVSLPELSALMFEGKYIWSSDNIRISRYEMSEDVGKEFALPIAAVKMLLKLENPKMFAEEAGWIHFLTESGVVFSAAPLDRQYPLDKIKQICYDYGCEVEGWDKQEEKEVDDPYYEWPSALLDYINVSAVMADEHEDFAVKAITIRREGNELLVGGSKDTGTVETPVEFEGDMFEEGITILIQPEFLKYIMGLTLRFSMPDESIVRFETGRLWQIMSVYVEGEEDE